MIDPHAPLPFVATVASDARPARRMTWDSREVDHETAFVALAGERMHGNQFVERALEAGAPFVLTSLDVPRAVRVADAAEALWAWAREARKAAPVVIGITGSAGKTTTKAYVTAALDGLAMPVFNTPPAIACFLLEHSGAGRPLVVEMGIDRLGEMNELMSLVLPDVGVVTSVGAAHLQQLGDIETVAREKGHILSAGWGLVGAQAASFYANSHPDVQSYGFGEVMHAGRSLRHDESGARFEWGGREYFLPLMARVQAEAAVLGLVLAERYNRLEGVRERLAGVKVPSGRFEVITGAWTVINDTYNASPLAAKASLDAMQGFSGRRISVLGRMLELGETERQLHAEVGEYAREHAHLTYGVGEFAAELGEFAFSTVPELIEALKAEVRAGDVLLVKASRGLSLTPTERLQWGVGLEVVVEALRPPQP